jgi:hypothetical protein
MLYANFLLACFGGGLLWWAVAVERPAFQPDSMRYFAAGQQTRNPFQPSRMLSLPQAMRRGRYYKVWYDDQLRISYWEKFENRMVVQRAWYLYRGGKLWNIRKEPAIP